MVAKKHSHNAEKLSVTLPHEIAQLVREKVESGTYASNSEVIREALNLFQAHETLQEQKIAALKEKVDHSVNTGGRSIEADKVFKNLEKRRPQQKP